VGLLVLCFVRVKASRRSPPIPMSQPIDAAASPASVTLPLAHLTWEKIDDKAFKQLPAAEQLHRIRHSAAHVMASAVAQLYPQAQFVTGPATGQGFHYDIKLPESLTLAELEGIQARYQKIAGQSLPFEVARMPKADAIAWFTETHQTYKLPILQRIPDEEVTLYRHGHFIDLCAGPHVPHTGLCRHVNLLNVSAVHYHAEDTPSLTRITGTAWAKEKDLNAYMEFLEAVKSRDHRVLGPQLDLFSFHPWAASAMWHPHGVTLRNTLMAFWRQTISQQAYVEVWNPLLYKKELFETSGHWSHFKDNMFVFKDGDNDEMALKPMNCPDTMLFFRSKKRSYRELPLRVAEGQILHRNEATGALHGLMRTRNFIQDDAHIFLTAEQVQPEVLNLLQLIDQTYGQFQLNYNVHFSTRPANYMGDAAVWDAAEAGLKAALDAAGKPYVIDEGEGAFYGPKVDIYIQDSLGREWQCGTVQLDFQLPQRFELTYVASDGSLQQPIVVHRAVFGSFERFIGILIEHVGGAFPTWLAPVQAVVLPIADRHQDYAYSVCQQLVAAGIRAEVAVDESVNYRIRQAETAKVPHMLVVGDKEAEAATVSVRTYQHGPQGVKSVTEVVTNLQTLVAERTFDVTLKDYGALFRQEAVTTQATDDDTAY
jgi:threonyl-tRNA synthetase